MTVRDELVARFGEIDIYLFDQLLRGSFDGRRRVLDAGCGGGRNLTWLLSAGFDVAAVDRSEEAVAAVRAQAARRAPRLPVSRFRVAELDALPFEDGAFDAVICSAVLHFAEDEAHFRRMVAELWRVLAGGGLLFTRLASSIGLEGRLVPVVGRPGETGPGEAADDGRPGRYRLPDGSERFLVDRQLLAELTETLGGRLLDPIKTTNVQDLRCMTTWCLHKVR